MPRIAYRAALPGTLLLLLAAGCGSSGHPGAAPSSGTAAAATSVPAAQGPAGTAACMQFGLVNSQITSAVQPGESGTDLGAALTSQGAAWGKSLSAAGAAAESGPDAATVAGDIDLAALHLDDAVLAANLGNDTTVSSQWAMTTAALAKAAKDCA